MTQLDAHPSADGALLGFGRAAVGQLELAGSLFVVEANRFGEFSTLELRRVGDRRLFALRGGPGRVDVGIRDVVDVATGRPLNVGGYPAQVMMVGDLLEAVPTCGAAGTGTQRGAGAA